MTDYVFKFQDKPETKLLILYIMYQSKYVADMPHVPKQFLSDFISEHINAEYFTVQQCLFELIQDSYIAQFVENHKDCLEMLEKGTYLIEQFFTQVPLSVRDKIDEVIVNSVKKYKNSRDVVVDYWAESKDCYTASLKIYEEDKIALHFSLSLPNELDAQFLAKKFKEKPFDFYKRIIGLSSEYIDEARKEKEDEERRLYKRDE